MIKIEVQSTRAVIRYQEPLTVGLRGAKAHFVFGDGWDGLVKTAVFRQGDKTVAVADIDAEVTVPWEVLTQPGLPVQIGVYGTNGSQVAIPTLWAVTQPVRPGTDPEADPSTEPTPGLWEQMQGKLDNLEASVNEASRAVKVTITQNADGSYTADRYCDELLDAYNAGYTVYCQYGSRVFPLLLAARSQVAFGCVYADQTHTVMIGHQSASVVSKTLAAGDGITPHIGANGNWFIGETDTGMPSRGEAGPTGAQGEKGEPGPQGIQGEQGPKGDPGSAGADGAKGEKGDKGDTGPQGEKGDAFTYSDFTAEQLASLKGEKGDKGDTGAQGPKGDTGAAGEKGEQGIQGEPGAKGDKGDKGDTGSQGPAGTDGKDGSNGKDGTSVTIKSVSESTADGGGNVVTFSDGKTLTVKNGSKGSKGDKGDKGDTGPKGDTGADGPQGPTGATGADGKTPVKGTDYWTQADQEAIVQQVITALGTPVFGRVDEGNNIILTGELIDGTYTLKYEDAEGNVTDIGTLTQGGTAYTNLANPSSGDWLTNQRLNSSGAVVDTTPAITTNYIPLKLNDDVRIRGLNIWHQGTSDGNATTWFYDENKNRVASTAPATAPSYYPKDNDGNGHAFNVSNSSNHKLTVLEGYSASDIRYARFVGKLYDGFTADDVIITVNQEITE